MNKRFIVLLLVIFSFTLIGKTKNETGVTKNLLTKLKHSLVKDAHFKFAQNAISNVDAKKLALINKKFNGIDSYFSNEIEQHKITNQKSSGRCWMFAGLNILRAQTAKNLKKKDIEFSQNYLFFYDKLEKANMFLEATIKSRKKPFSDRYVEFIIKHPTPDGGQWVAMVELVKKYGVVPKEVMPETFSSSKSRTLNRVLGLRLRKALVDIRSSKSKNAIKEIKFSALRDVYKILAIHLGTPPETFSWRYKNIDKKLISIKNITPRNFYKNYVRVNLDNYYCFQSIPVRAFNKLYQIDLDKAVYDGPEMSFVNLPISELKKMTKKSIIDNEPVWFGCDVSRGMRKGYFVSELSDYESIYKMNFKLTKKQTFETYTNNPLHAMVFCGVDIVNNKTKKWKVENSWGSKGHKGYYYMQNDWFDFYVQSVIINKKYISNNILNLFKTKATILPPWDPMYKAVSDLH